jgi:hypothetical protein
MSRSANAGKLPWCAGGKSLARKLLCDGECVIDSKWSDADGEAQVRFRLGARAEVSVNDVRLYSKRGRRSEHPS